MGNGCVWMWVIHLPDGLELPKHKDVLVGVPVRSDVSQMVAREGFEPPTFGL